MEKQETEKLKRTRKRTAETEIPKQLLASYPGVAVLTLTRVLQATNAGARRPGYEAKQLSHSAVMCLAKSVASSVAFFVASSSGEYH